MNNQPKFKRVVIKIGGDAFSKNREDWFNMSALNFLVEEIKMAYRLCQQIVIVPGGGNIIRGRELRNLGLDQRTADQDGMLATCLNGSNLRSVLEQHKIPVRLQTAIEMKPIGEPYIPLRAGRHLEKGRIVIVAGGLGIPEFTTDTAAVIRAIELGADVVLKATNVEGIFDQDPKYHGDSKFLPTLTYDEARVLKVKVFDSTTVTKAQDANLPVVVFKMDVGNLAKVLLGEPVGTLLAHPGIIASWRQQEEGLC